MLASFVVVTLLPWWERTGPCSKGIHSIGFWIADSGDFLPRLYGAALMALHAQRKSSYKERVLIGVAVTIK